jgi:hypothetical protein
MGSVFSRQRKTVTSSGGQILDVGWLTKMRNGKCEMENEKCLSGVWRVDGRFLIKKSVA